MNKFGKLSVLLTAVLTLLLGGCSNEPDTGPGKIRWDRDVCERCVMAVSDPNFSAQIRGGPVDGKQKLYKFDDLGCAVIWLDEQDWKNNPAVEIWINHYQTGEWIDARKAWYVKNQLTPMNYGLGAQVEHAPGALNFEQARTHIYKIEEELNLHGGGFHLAPPITPSKAPTK